MIDRADYMIFTDNEDDRLEAYEDHAWRRGTLHLSAPCIYTRALEALKLSKGIIAQTTVTILDSTGPHFALFALVLDIAHFRLNILVHQKQN